MSAMQAKIMASWADAVLGDPQRAAADLADGLARYQTFGARLKVPYFVGLQADATLAAADPEGALELLDLAAAEMAATTRSFFFEPELHRLRAAALVGGSGDVQSARDALDLALARAEALGSPPLALRAACDRLRLESERGDAETWRSRVDQLLAVFDGQAQIPDTATAAQLLDA